MRVGDLMQAEPATLNADDHLDLADDIMRLGRIRHLPVVSGGALVGMLSQRDLYRAGLSSLLQLKYTAERDWLSKIPVKAVMATNVITIGPHASMRRAVKSMLEHKIGCLPVVDDGRLVGLLSETDCLRFLTHVLDTAEARSALPEIVDSD